MTADGVISVVTSLGLPTAFCIGLSFIVYYLVKNMLATFRDTNNSLLDTNKSNIETLVTMTDSLRSLHKRIDATSSDISTIKEQVTIINTKIDNGLSA